VRAAARVPPLGRSTLPALPKVVTQPLEVSRALGGHAAAQPAHTVRVLEKMVRAVMRAMSEDWLRAYHIRSNVAHSFTRPLQAIIASDFRTGTHRHRKVRGGMCGGRDTACNLVLCCAHFDSVPQARTDSAITVVEHATWTQDLPLLLHERLSPTRSGSWSSRRARSTNLRRPACRRRRPCSTDLASENGREHGRMLTTQNSATRPRSVWLH